MKKGITTCIMMMIAFSSLFATTADSLDIRKLVYKQIEEAKAKQNNEVRTQVVSGASTLVPTNAISSSENSEQSYTFYKILFLFAASGMVGAIVYYNRRKKQNIEQTIQLKKNIQMMRQEKFIKRIDPRLKQIRTQLCLNSTQLKGITNAARKLNIGKEELVIASRIEEYQRQYNYDRRAV